MIEKKYRLVATIICFLIIAIAMCVLLSYSILRVMNLFLNYPSINQDYTSLHFFAGITGIITGSFGLPFAIYFVYTIVREDKDDRNIYNCFAGISLAYYAYKGATMFFYMYILFKNGGQLDGFAISVPILFVISFLLAFFTLYVRKVYQKKIASFLHSLVSSISLALLLIYEVEGFPVATAISFLVTEIAIMAYSCIGLPSFRIRFNKEFKEKAIELEDRYDNNEIDEETFYLEETRIRLKEK